MSREYIVHKPVELDATLAKFRKKFPTVADLKHYWLQKKYDGCFGVAVLLDDGTQRMLSRTNEDYTPSCKHILRELREALEVAGQDSGVFLGEVWHPDYTFPVISGKFRKNAPSNLAFVANDFLSVEDFQAGHCDEPYKSRHQFLLDVLPEVEGGYVSTAVTLYQWTGHPHDYAMQWKAEGGFDGAIMRDPDGTWCAGAGKTGEIIKVKPVESLDLLCIGFDVQPGPKTGRPVLTLVVSYKGKPVGVGSGVPHSMKAADVVGKIVEVEAMGESTEGALREPRFKGIRHDKLQPDA
jgi:ATP-dependent DNA ligase